VEERPARLSADRAYDSDKLETERAAQAIQGMAPHRRNRVHQTRDGGPLGRYQQRWRLERLFAGLPGFRRLAVRWELRAENWWGFVPLGGVLILLRRGLAKGERAAEAFMGRSLVRICVPKQIAAECWAR
jgi:hypothetical protein